jgi:hypothetical protein
MLLGVKDAKEIRGALAVMVMVDIQGWMFVGGGKNDELCLSPVWQAQTFSPPTLIAKPSL